MSAFFSRGLPPCIDCEGGGGTGDQISEQINDDPPQETDIDYRVPVSELDVPGGDDPPQETGVDSRTPVAESVDSCAPVLALYVPDVDDPPQETAVDSHAPVPEVDVPGGVPSGDTHGNIHGGETPVDNPETQVINSEQTRGNIPNTDIRVNDSQQTSDNTARHQTAVVGARNSAL